MWIFLRMLWLTGRQNRPVYGLDRAWSQLFFTPDDLSYTMQKRGKRTFFMILETWSILCKENARSYQKVQVSGCHESGTREYQSLGTRQKLGYQANQPSNKIWPECKCFYPSKFIKVARHFVSAARAGYVASVLTCLTWLSQRRESQSCVTERGEYRILAARKLGRRQKFCGNAWQSWHK